MSAKGEKKTAVKPKAPGKKAAPKEATKKASKEAPAAAPKVEPKAESPKEEPKVVAAPKVAASKADAGEKSKHPVIATSRVHHFTHLINSAANNMLEDRKKVLKPYDDAVESLKSGKTKVEVEVTETVDGKEVKKTKSEERAITDQEKADFTKLVKQHEANVPKLRAEAQALKSVRFRFTDNTDDAIAFVCDEWVSELLQHAMDTALEVKKKTIEPKHLHMNGSEKLRYYSLVANLKSFAAMREQVLADMGEENFHARLTVALEEEEKKWRELHGVKKKKAPVVQAPVQEQQEEAEAPAEAAEAKKPGSRDTFNTYLTTMVKQIISANPAKYQLWSKATETEPSKPVLDKHGNIKTVIKVSADIKRHLSECIIEFIDRVVVMTAGSVRDKGNKTIDADSVLNSVRSIMTLNQPLVNVVTLVPAKVQDQAKLKAEMEKKEAEKKAGRAYEINEKAIPLVDGFTAESVMTFPSSSYEALRASVLAKLELLKKVPATN